MTATPRTGRNILVTGGAGFIGSHTAKRLSACGYRPVVYDDLSSGHREAVQWGPLVEGDIRDREELVRIMRQYEIDAVIHFASLIEVGRSMVRPDLFYDVNVTGLSRVLEAMRECKIQRIVFSSSAAVYGLQDPPTLAESTPTQPSSCYGETKLAGEKMIESFCRAFGMTGIALRYFNAAGADPEGELGECHQPETHLIPLAIGAAVGSGPPLTVFGMDFPTPDGSCVRDYVHVADLANAHVAALELDDVPGFEVLNLGVGHGYSVLEVLKTVKETVGAASEIYTLGQPRAGDPPRLVADAGLATKRLQWRPERSELQTIVADAVNWARAPKFGPLTMPSPAPRES